MISVVVFNLLRSYKVSFLITHVSVASATCKLIFSLHKFLKSTREECNRNMFWWVHLSCMSLVWKDLFPLEKVVVICMKMNVSLFLCPYNASFIKIGHSCILIEAVLNL